MPVTPPLKIEAKVMKKLKEAHKSGYKHSVEDRIDVVGKYMLTGNLRLVSEMTGISYGLLRQWKMEPWFDEIRQEIQQSKRFALDNKLGKIIDGALEVMADRLVNGDVTLNHKTGQLQRVPVDIRAATQAANSLLQRQEALAHLEEKVDDTQDQRQTQDILASLAQEFAKFNTNRTKSVEEIQFKETPDAIHEEREEGLREGESVGPLPRQWPETEGQGRPEQGSLDPGESREGTQT